MTFVKYLLGKCVSLQLDSTSLFSAGSGPKSIVKPFDKSHAHK